MKTKKQAEKRLARAQELAAQVKAGTYLPPQMNLQESWFPARPIVKKDKLAIEKIFGPTAGNPPE